MASREERTAPAGDAQIGIGAANQIAVAARAGVSRATVSRAMNPATRGLLADATLQRVLAAVEELGYRPDQIARTMRTRRSLSIGVLIPDVTNWLFPPMLRGIDERLRADGYRALIAYADERTDDVQAQIEALRARQVDGLIVATATREDAALTVSGGPPIALMNRRVHDDAIPSVIADDVHGVRKAIAHLASLGHREIVHVAAPQELSTGYARREAFLAAMAERGLAADERSAPVAGAVSELEGARACRALLDGGQDFTAIVAANDLLALGCYDALSERGLDCPDDVSVVGYNDMPFAHRFTPPLTTVRFDHRQMGLAAADVILRLIDGEPGSPPPHIVLDTDLVIRGSTARAPPPRR